MHKYPHYPLRLVAQLDGLWAFHFLGDVEPDAINLASLGQGRPLPVPGCFDATGEFAGKRGVGVYRTTFRLSSGRRAKLWFGGLGIWGRVVVDGQPLIEHHCAYSPFRCDVPASDAEERELHVLVDNRFSENPAALQCQYFDFYAYGGIFRSVSLHELNRWSIERALVTPLDLQGKLRVQVVVEGDLPESTQLVLTCHQNATQQTIFSESVSPTRITESHPLWNTLHKNQLRCTRAPVAVIDRIVQATGLTPWSPSSPQLCRLDVHLSDGELSDQVVERFGLRIVAVDGRNLLLNGQPLRLLGYNRHEAHPQFGPALPLAQLVQDLHLLQSMGCNAVRGSHYCQDQRFLELCDEEGLLVWEESLGWQQHEIQLTTKEFMDGQEDQTTAMVVESFNHPSVVVWGFLNEGASHLSSTRPAYQRLAEVIRKVDDSRLVSYASNHPFDDQNFDQCDIISINCYPGWYADASHQRPLEEVVQHLRRISESLEARGFHDRPVIISEIGAGAVYGFRDQHRAHWSEEYQADLLEEVCRCVASDPYYAGLLIWQMYDMRTYSNSRALFRPRAFNNKGTFDEYRRPKLAYEVVKRYFNK